jgi:hypothetical protein
MTRCGHLRPKTSQAETSPWLVLIQSLQLAIGIMLLSLYMESILVPGMTKTQLPSSYDSHMHGKIWETPVPGSINTCKILQIDRYYR